MLKSFTVDYAPDIPNAILPNIASITSPGMKRTERKTRIVNRNRVGITSNSRLMI